MKAVEQWKPIVGYEGKYEVSNLGNIKSVNYGIIHPPRSTCTSLGTCKEYDNFVKFMERKKMKC